MALALQAWYQDRQHARAEHTYVRQLAADLAATERALEGAIREDSISFDATAARTAALRTRGVLSAEAARKWLMHAGGSYSDPRLVLGTVGTLLQTGDIGLIRNPDLRSRIVAYSDFMASDLEELGRNVDRLIQANDAERLQLARLGHLQEWVTTDGELASYFPSYQADWPSMQADPDLHAAYLKRAVAYANRLGYLRRMLNATAELRHALLPASPVHEEP